MRRESPVTEASSPTTLPASVIVCSLDRPALLADCVASVLAGDEIPREIVVIDQSAVRNHGLAELGRVHGCLVRYHQTRAGGVSAARNEGAALASEEILVYTDDDMLVDRAWLGALVRAATSGRESEIVTGRVLQADEEDPTTSAAPSLIADEEPRTYTGRLARDVLYSGNMAFGRRVFQGVGPFDVRLGPGKSYFSAEDNDFGFRALEAGYSIRYVPEAVAFHRPWRSTKAASRRHWEYGVGQGAYYTKHIHLHDRHAAVRLRSDIVRHAKRAVGGFSHDRQRAKDEAVYVLGLVYGSARWFLLERLRRR